MLARDTHRPPGGNPIAAILEFKNVAKWFPVPRAAGPLKVLNGVTFAIDDREEGEFVALLGPSGSGKSTILNMISGLLLPDEGEVLLAGQPVAIGSHQTATVSQAYTCYPWRTVRANVEFGLELRGMPSKERKALALEYLDKVGLADRADSYPRELSGGMQQRVAIARTLALRPPVVLMDEPFGALDAQTRSDMQQMLMNLWSVERNLVFFITHDIAEAVLLADRVLVLGARPSHIVHDLAVPFVRPRPPELTMEPLFAHLVQTLLTALRSGGQVQA